MSTSRYCGVGDRVGGGLGGRVGGGVGGRVGGGVGGVEWSVVVTCGGIITGYGVVMCVDVR